MYFHLINNKIIWQINMICNIQMKNKLVRFLLIGLLCSLFCSCKSDDCDTNSEEKTETNIVYTITMSPDLLKFVTPQVSYVDENGNLVSITGVEDLDRKVIESKIEIENASAYASAWTSQLISGTGYKCWSIQMQFIRLDFHSYMGVKYLRNDFTEDTSNKKYNFHHNVNTSISQLHYTKTSNSVYVDSHVSVTYGNYKEGDDIELYLKNLENSPDKVGYFIDGEGNITRMDEFEL